MTWQEQFDRCAKWIAAALEHAGGTHTMDDVRDLIDEGRLQLWPGERSAVVTEIVEYPRAKDLHFFLAGGDMDEMRRMRPVIEQWGAAMGCTRVTLAGRRGWARSFLGGEGYQERWTVMVKEMT